MLDQAEPSQNTGPLAHSPRCGQNTGPCSSKAESPVFLLAVGWGLLSGLGDVLGPLLVALALPASSLIDSSRDSTALRGLGPQDPLILP